METSSVYRKNVSCLKSCHPDVFQSVRHGSPPPSSLPFRHEEDIIAEQIQWIRSALQSGGDFFYFFGLGNGSVFVSTAEEIIRENRGILVIEPSVQKFSQVLGRWNMISCFRSGKIFWAIGRDIKKKITQLVDTHLCFAAAEPRFFILDTGEDDPYHATLETTLFQVREEVIRKKKQLIDRIHKLSQSLTVRSKPPYRVWTYDDYRGKAGYSIIQKVLIRNLFHELRKRGYETEYTILQDHHYYPPYYRILRMVQFQPDIIFLCNTAPAYEISLGAELSRSLNIPKVVWFADDPVYAEHLLQRSKTSPDETYLVADYEWIDPLLEQGAAPPRFMPGAATQTCFGKKRGGRKCEVVFVGQVRDQRDFFQSLSSGWRQYCQKVVQEKIRFPRKKIRQVMAQFPMPDDLEADRLDELRQKLLWEANTRFRVSVIRSLGDYDLHLYGNDAWKSLLPEPMVERCFRGVVRFKRLAEVYRNASITLNIHSLQSYTCLNVRDFDVPAVGGFLLTDWLAKAEEIFVPGFVSDLPVHTDSPQELFFYRSIPELKQLIDYFLQHPDLRRACMERARKRILSAHTYAHRAAWLDRLFQELIRDYQQGKEGSSWK